jgi:hypothetical protein
MSLERSSTAASHSLRQVADQARVREPFGAAAFVRGLACGSQVEQASSTWVRSAEPYRLAHVVIAVLPAATETATETETATDTEPGTVARSRSR